MTESEDYNENDARWGSKNKFGVLMDTVQREAEAISKKGRTAAIVLPVQEYEEYKALKLERLRREIKIGLDQIERGEAGAAKNFSMNSEKTWMIDAGLHTDGSREGGLAEDKRLHEENMGQGARKSLS